METFPSDLTQLENELYEKVKEIKKLLHELNIIRKELNQELDLN